MTVLNLTLHFFFFFQKQSEISVLVSITDGRNKVSCDGADVTWLLVFGVVVIDFSNNN